MAELFLILPEHIIIAENKYRIKNASNRKTEVSTLNAGILEVAYIILHCFGLQFYDFKKSLTILQFKSLMI